MNTSWQRSTLPLYFFQHRDKLEFRYIHETFIGDAQLWNDHQASRDNCILGLLSLQPQAMKPAKTVSAFW